MRPLSTRFSVCITTLINISILGFILSTFPAPALATTTIIRTSTKTTKPSTNTPYILPFFLPDSEPLSLVGSVIAAPTTIHKTTITTTILTSSSGNPISSLLTVTTTLPPSTQPNTPITLQIDCPPPLTATAPENTPGPADAEASACRAARIYPALITLSPPSPNLLGNPGDVILKRQWKGETTNLVGDDATTTWTCWQGMDMMTAPAGPEMIRPLEEMVPYARCVSTIVESGGGLVRFTTRRYDECYFWRHMVPIVVDLDSGGGVLAGMGGGGGGGADVEEMNAGWERELRRLGCEMGGSRTMWAGTVRTQVAVVTAVGTGSVESTGRGLGGLSRRAVAVMGVVGVGWLVIGGGM